jgi:ATP-binding protein involved in chromosome partitioning
LFGEGGGDRLAVDYGVGMLGALPLRLSIREQTDDGTPTVAADPEGEISGIFREIARQVGASLWRSARNTSPRVPVIETVED